MTTDIDASDLLRLQAELMEARALAKFAVTFMAPASPGRMAAEQVIGSWEEPIVLDDDGEAA